LIASWYDKFGARWRPDGLSTPRLVQPQLLSISRPFQILDIWPRVRYEVIAGGKEVRASSVLLLVQVGEGGVLAGEVQLNNPQNRPKAALSVLTLDPGHGKPLYALSCRYRLPLAETRSPSRE
jgi:hypothetical protein